MVRYSLLSTTLLIVPHSYQLKPLEGLAAKSKGYASKCGPIFQTQATYGTSVLD
jgi:hypothetical protein